MDNNVMSVGRVPNTITLYPQFYIPAIQPVSWLCSVSHVLFTWKWCCCRNIWRKCVQCEEFRVRTTPFKYNGQYSWPGKVFNIVGEAGKKKAVVSSNVG